MTNALTTFAYNAATIRVIDIDGEPWFVAADVCRVLGIKNTANAVRPLARDEQSVYQMNTGGGLPRKTISESGLYKIIMRSDKPEAKAFQDWVTREVLPSIRKTGKYEAPVDGYAGCPAPEEETYAPMTAMQHMQAALKCSQDALQHALKAVVVLEAENEALKANPPMLTQQPPKEIAPAKDELEGWITVREWCRINRKTMSDKQKQDLGQFASWLCEENGIVPVVREQFSHRNADTYEANAYPAWIITDARADMLSRN